MHVFDSGYQNIQRSTSLFHQLKGKYADGGGSANLGKENRAEKKQNPFNKNKICSVQGEIV